MQTLEVKAFPIYNDKEKTVDLNFHVNPGSRVHVSQVLITGNDSTDDTVIRRELRQYGWFLVIIRGY